MMLRHTLTPQFDEGILNSNSGATAYEAGAPSLASIWWRQGDSNLAMHHPLCGVHSHNTYHNNLRKVILLGTLFGTHDITPSLKNMTGVIRPGLGYATS